MIHERFDVAQWKSVFSLADDLGGTAITSPYDMVVVETIRERVCLEKHAEVVVPTDVFIMAKGEPTNRAVTKIGGLPYWPGDRPWPCGASGQPLTFVAQFNFADSKDITGQLPGDILVFFTDLDMGCGYGDVEEGYSHLAWFSLDQRFPLVDRVPEEMYSIDSCYGMLYRTADYDDIESDILDAYGQPYYATCLECTKIGGIPRWIQEETEIPGRYLCSISSVQPAFEQPYPFVNVPEPITSFAEYSQMNNLLIGDAGSYYLFLDDTGHVHVTEQCY